jgi:hypothetical protein
MPRKHALSGSLSPKTQLPLALTPPPPHGTCKFMRVGRRAHARACVLVRVSPSSIIPTYILDSCFIEQGRWPGILGLLNQLQMKCPLCTPPLSADCISPVCVSVCVCVHTHTLLLCLCMRDRIHVLVFSFHPHAQTKRSHHA